MLYLLEHSERAPEVDDLARSWVYETLKREELLWRPWLSTHMEVEGTEILELLTSRGTGCVLSFMHQGMYMGLFGSLGALGFTTHVATLPAFFRGDVTGPVLWRRQQIVRVFGGNGARPFPARGAYSTMLDLVAAGEIVAIATDVPGRLPMTFLGRRVSAASGPARLALEAEIPIVPVTSHRSGHRQRFRIEEPIWPAEHADLNSMQQAIADRHAPAILAWPEAVQEPLARWGPIEEEDVARFTRQKRSVDDE
jgi:lauroyl/myristoyl acyltransferase